MSKRYRTIADIEPDRVARLLASDKLDRYSYWREIDANWDWDYLVNVVSTVAQDEHGARQWRAAFSTSDGAENIHWCGIVHPASYDNGDYSRQLHGSQVKLARGLAAIEAVLCEKNLDVLLGLNNAISLADHRLLNRMPVNLVDDTVRCRRRVPQGSSARAKAQIRLTEVGMLRSAENHAGLSPLRRWLSVCSQACWPAEFPEAQPQYSIALRSYWMGRRVRRYLTRSGASSVAVVLGLLHEPDAYQASRSGATALELMYRKRTSIAE